MPDNPPSVLLDDARPGQERLLRFSRPTAIIRADTPDQVGPALALLTRAAGNHLAGYFSYELGYLLEDRLRPLLPAARNVPLLWFGVFERCETIAGADVESWLTAAAAGRAWAGPLRHDWDRAAYGAAFNQVQQFIRDGDIYQANLSFRSRFRFVGDPLALYAALRRHARGAHCAYVDDGERQILSLSPELFFTLSADGLLRARPMKGTAPRGANADADRSARQNLAASAKDRAENLMIVDLLRNDLGRIAETGSVAVEELFTVETYPTLHTMVSTITAALKRGTGQGDLLKALFPCGSVTGAPKIRAMEIIRTLEESARGPYCGAIGHFAPDGSARFNVAIRTLTISGAGGELGIGGAVVHDSVLDNEYDECLLKARYFEAARRPLELIETLRHAAGAGFIRLALHLARMERSAAVFGITFNRETATATLADAVHGSDGALRVRLVLNEDGQFQCTATPLPPAPTEWRFAFARAGVQSNDQILRHKTSWRELQERELAACGADEAVFLNEHGAVTEGCRSNVFVERDGRLLTPALSCGLLDGCLRRELIDRGQCEEVVLTRSDLMQAEKVWLGNSLRGLIPARLARNAIG